MIFQDQKVDWDGSFWWRNSNVISVFDQKHSRSTVQKAGNTLKINKKSIKIEIV